MSLKMRENQETNKSKINRKKKIKTREKIQTFAKNSQ